MYWGQHDGETPIAMSFYSGLRLGEIQGIRWEDCDSEIGSHLCSTSSREKQDWADQDGIIHSRCSYGRSGSDFAR